MDSAGYEQQMAGIRAQLDPMLTNMPGANDYFKKGLNEAYGYNLPLLKEGAALEAGAYTLPGQLMSQYNNEFGNVFGGASGTGRLNSILGRLGNQFSLADVASGLADRQGARIEDMAGNLSEQYGLGIQGLQSKYDMLSPLFQAKLQQEEAARNRAASRGSGSSSTPNIADVIADYFGGGDTGNGDTSVLSTISPTATTLTPEQQAAKFRANQAADPSGYTPIKYSVQPQTGQQAWYKGLTSLFNKNKSTRGGW